MFIFTLVLLTFFLFQSSPSETLPLNFGVDPPGMVLNNFWKTAQKSTTNHSFILPLSPTTTDLVRYYNILKAHANIKFVPWQGRRGRTRILFPLPPHSPTHGGANSMRQYKSEEDGTSSHTQKGEDDEWCFCFLDSTFQTDWLYAAHHSHTHTHTHNAHLLETDSGGGEITFLHKVWAHQTFHFCFYNLYCIVFWVSRHSIIKTIFLLLL